MQTPQSGTDLAIDSWAEGGWATSDQSTRSLLAQRLVVRICVSIVTVAILVGSALWSQVAPTRYHTRLGELGYVELPDGSMTILNTATEIELAFTGNVRRIKLLQGEALFDVAPDPHRMFVVEASGFRVETQAGNGTPARPDGARVGWLVDYARDVATPLTRRTSHTLFATRGTTFALWRKSYDTIDLAVLEGSTEVRHRAPTRLMPAHFDEDTVVQASGNAPLPASGVDSRRLEAKVSWLNRRVVLIPNATIREAAEEFNRYNEVQLLAQGSMGNRQIRGSFKVDQPDEFAHAIQQASGARVELSGNLMTIRDPDSAAASR
jgi:transmembrane sensor